MINQFWAVVASLVATVSTFMSTTVARGRPILPEVSPKVDTDVDTIDTTATVVPKVVPPKKPKRRPWHKRRQQLQRALTAAWEEGHRTYPALIESVRQQTGKGCSRRAIATFKRERGLIAA